MEKLTGVDARTGAQRFGAELRHHWLIVAILVVTATRTFDIFLATSWWPIAAVGVLICEGSWFFWNDHIDHAHRDLQRWIAIGAVAVTWLTILATSAADIAWQASQRKLFGVFTMPLWADMAAMGSVVAIGLIHAALHRWYTFVDPIEQMRRQKEHNEREIAYQGIQAKLEMEHQIQQTELTGMKTILPKAAQLMGTLRLNSSFYERFGLHPDDIKNGDITRLIKALDKAGRGLLTGKEVTNQEQTEIKQVFTAAPPSSNGKPVEQGGGVDHRNFTG